MLLPLREAWRVYSGLIRCNEDMLQCCYANCFKLNMTALSLNIKDGVIRRGEPQSPQNKQKRHSIISRLYLFMVHWESLSVAHTDQGIKCKRIRDYETGKEVESWPHFRKCPAMYLACLKTKQLRRPVSEPIFPIGTPRIHWNASHSTVNFGSTTVR
jgi:hypothetical protein